MTGITDRPEMFADDGSDEPKLDLDSVGRLAQTPLELLAIPRDEYRPTVDEVATYGLSAGMLPRSNERAAVALDVVYYAWANLQPAAGVWVVDYFIDPTSPSVHAGYPDSADRRAQVARIGFAVLPATATNAEILRAVTVAVGPLTHARYAVTACAVTR